MIGKLKRGIVTTFALGSFFIPFKKVYSFDKVYLCKYVKMSFSWCIHAGVFTNYSCDRVGDIYASLFKQRFPSLPATSIYKVCKDFCLKGRYDYANALKILLDEIDKCNYSF